MRAKNWRRHYQANTQLELRRVITDDGKYDTEIR